MRFIFCVNFKNGGRYGLGKFYCNDDFEVVLGDDFNLIQYLQQQIKCINSNPLCYCLRSQYVVYVNSNCFKVSSSKREL